MKFLLMFLKLFDDIPVAALGNTASENLNQLDIKHTKLRHPANGGATLFREGLKKFVK